MILAPHASTQARASIGSSSSTPIVTPPDPIAQLVANLLASLPSVLTDQDEGINEALRRDVELAAGEGGGGLPPPALPLGDDHALRGLAVRQHGGQHQQ